METEKNESNAEWINNIKTNKKNLRKAQKQYTPGLAESFAQENTKLKTSGL